MNPKSFVAVALAGAAFASALLAPASSSGQAGAGDDPALAVQVAEVAIQQATVLENQGKIDAKLATIAETLRLSRIYVGRGGGKVP